jgi:hypothetical protein
MKVLYEVLVPTMYGFPKVTPISTRHHKNWDKEVQKITGGLTIMKPAQGRWVDKGVEYPERIIPVRIMCEERENSFKASPGGMTSCPDNTQITKIIQLTLRHYRQKAVMYYVVSNDVRVVYATEFKLTSSRNGQRPCNPRS